MVAGTINIKGERYVIIPEAEYRGFVGNSAELPPLPEPESDGTVDALAYSRASIARDIIRDRRRLGLSQAELARRAGIPAETLNRIEKMKTSPATRILERIDKVLTKSELTTRV
jgi:ribosome-binding protein aMBF1 (putative translation factor)